MLVRLAYLAVTNVLAAVSAFVTPKRLTRLPSSFAVDAVGHAEATEDLTEHTEPFYGRILERFDCHRDELTAEYGVEAVERVESVISNCAAMSGMGSILLTGFKPAFPPLTG